MKVGVSIGKIIEKMLDKWPNRCYYIHIH